MLACLGLKLGFGKLKFASFIAGKRQTLEAHTTIGGSQKEIYKESNALRLSWIRGSTPIRV